MARRPLAVPQKQLYLPTPVGLQAEWLASGAVQKVLRIGRRGGKTRFALIAAIAGHGPETKFPGIMQGTVEEPKDVVWISVTYSNLSTVLWREEIVPRVAGLPWVTLDAQQHDVHFHGHGSLLLRSAEPDAIASVRGAGKRLAGVIIDEAAHLDLKGALLDVVLPALLDNNGWLILMSTTNRGKDGGYQEDGSPQVPSYFNVICEQIRAGERPGWVEFHGTAYDNPVISPQGIDALVQEYPAESAALKQEVFAELLNVGVGLALPELGPAHWIPLDAIGDFAPLPKHWFAGCDWGYNHPWALPFGWRDSDGNVVIRDTLWGRRDAPHRIAEIATVGLRHAPVQQIWTSHDAWARKGAAIGSSVESIGVQLQQSGLPFIQAAADSGPIRVTGLDNLRRYLAVPPDGMPLLRFVETEGNKRLVKQLAAMQLDPRDPEDALKVDADSEGRGGDDGYEALRRMMAAFPIALPRVHAHGPVRKDPDKALPLTIEHGRLVSHPKQPRTVEEMAQWADQHQRRTHSPLRTAEDRRTRYRAWRGR